MRNLAIIPARSGSKGLKDKNIKDLNGKPLMAYSIEAAVRSGMFDAVMVSTDSEQYAEIAKSSGAEVPFLRSERTSTDSASSWDMVWEVLENYSGIGREFDTFMLLQPTSPLRSAEDILNAYELFEKKEANAVVSVCPVDHSPLQCSTLPEDLSMTDFMSGWAKGRRRQDLEEYYRLNGAIYLSDVEYFRAYKDIYKDRCYALIMGRDHSVDIDDSFDFKLVEALLLLNNKEH